MRPCLLSSFSFLFATMAFAANAPRFTFGFSGVNVNPGAIAVDSQSNTYLAGSTAGTPVTATPGAYQSQNHGGTCYGGGPGSLGPGIPMPCRNIFVIKLDPFGNTVFATYLGGTANADALAIAVGADGSVYIAGSVEISPSPGAAAFPITAGAAYTSVSGNAGNGAFVAKLNASGTALEYSTFLPGLFLDSIALDPVGAVYFVGQATSIYGTFPATAGAYQTSPRRQDASIAIGKLSPDGSSLVWGTYLSAAMGASVGGGIALDSGGNVLVGGSTTASDFPATSGQFSTAFGDAEDGYRNLFLARLSADGSRLISASLLGPAAGRLTMGPGGDIYLTAFSPSLPVTSEGFGLTGGLGNYLLRITPDASGVANSIRLPFVPQETSVDAEGNAYLIGAGSVTATLGAYQSQASGIGPYYNVIAKIAPDGTVAGGTYFDQAGSQIAVEQDGSVMVAGGSTGAFFAANLFPSITLENGASYVANVAIPGELVSIRGYGLGPDQGQVSPPTANLDGVQVSFDGFPAPLIYAQAGQINAQVPWEIAGQTSTQVQILFNGTLVGYVKAPVAPASPGIFYIENADSSVNSLTNPAHAGDTIAIYGTGAGSMSPPGATGSNWPLAPLSHLDQPVAVTVDGQPASGIPYAGSAPTLSSGLFQVDVTLPATTGSGAPIPLILTIGTAGTPPSPLFVQ